MPFFTQHVLAFCGNCEWHERVECPRPSDTARVIRHAKAHALREQHAVSIERGQIYGQSLGPR